MKNSLSYWTIFLLLQGGGALAQRPAIIKGSNIMDRTIERVTEQKRPKKKLFQYGVASAFIEGAYKGDLPIRDLLAHGDLGIGAPDLINGELTIVDGKAYQSTAEGHTFEPAHSLTTPFAFVTRFKPGGSKTLVDIRDINELFARSEALLPNRNGIYALRIRGDFSMVRTRAFPPVEQRPFKPLAQMLDQQHFFEFKEISGDLIGFYMPGYLSGINITGLHFHFLSKDRKKGGHLVALSAKKVEIEISELEEFHLRPANNGGLENFEFRGGNSPSLQKIERGQ